MLDFIQHNLWPILLGLNYLTAFVVALFIISNNRNPIRTISYILVLITFPFVGLIVYYFFGTEYRKSKMFQRKMVFSSPTIKKWEERLKLSTLQLEKLTENLLENKIKIVKLVQRNQYKPLVLDNEVKILINGEEKFKSLYQDLCNAKKHIHLEYYIIKDDTTGLAFIDIICQKAKQGIQVRLSYDDVGSKLSRKTKQKLSAAGVEHYPFMPVLFSRLTRKLNYRDHRKIAIIDGEIGYLGGINISDNYANLENKTYWRDTHIKVSGDVVKLLQSQFLLNWNFVSKTEIQITDDFFPEIEKQGNIPVQLVASGPDSSFPHIMEALFTAINTATKQIVITTPYFIPNEQILTALTTASRRGVEVQVLIPKQGDTWTATYATNSYIEQLLRSGVKVFRYTKGMIHAKVMLVDDNFSSIGTSNMDYRSFEINFEINALIYHKETTAKMYEIYHKDLQDAEMLTLAAWRQRSRTKKIKESFSRLWAPLL
ncbi:cardiolipin synthase [Mesonia hippocampi]|nr:cardiolipin synthase [Mesonia hippocampi]